ncbi:hypothetical protein HL653_11320 [Sphingomonas sp. AP4-R1]|uniref:gamma-glutamyltransferase family protein n=1 Tax=Sphingomonas sp. AP4-R1 TaxID=2735134 RepID=UPI001493D745|nr:gamma-glutamyltransferase [Sphingomonas sp. AP4-R1]QJU58293.1 hypothetical protein HL653_11320 [Sphingomonas sp. AP4-R1]
MRSARRRSGIHHAALLVAASLAVPAIAQEQGPKPAVRAAHAMASSSNPIVTRTMVEVMRRGGNAMDAVLASIPVATVVEPQMVTLAGGAGILYFEAKTGRYHYLDAELDHTADGAAMTAGWTDLTVGRGEQVPITSGKRVAVPGVVAGMKAAADRFGTLRWADYFAPAVKISTQGFPMSSFLYGELSAAAQTVLAAYPSGRDEYLPQGYPAPVGTTVRFPHLATAMQRLQAEGPDYMYSGEWAHHLVEQVHAAGGSMTLADLAQYKPRWEEPVRSTFRNFEIVSAPPPATGGILIGMTLNILEHYDLAAHPDYAASAASLEMVRRAVGAAETATDEYVRDPLSYEVPVASLLSKDYARMLYNIAAGSMPRAAGLPPLTAVRPPASGLQLAADFTAHGRHTTDTTHVVAVDKDGNMASLTHSVYGNTFGPGFVIDGIQANSGNSFPGNVAGAGRRTISPFPPTMVVKDGKPWMTIGSPGLASEAVAITLINRLGYGKDLLAATDAPRFSGSQVGVDFVVENRLAPGVLDELKTRYQVSARPTVPYMWHFGSIQAIERLPDGSLLGVADARRAGSVAGY